MSVPFEADFQIDFHDCDINNLLRPAGYLRYMQETANLHCESSGFGYDACRNTGRVFVLTRLAVDVLKPLHSYDSVTGQTWACPGKGYSFPRCSTLLSGGKPAAILSSVWAYIDFESKTPVKVSDSGLLFETGEPTETVAPLKFHLPKDLPLKEVGKVRVGYSVCDRNMHMNNTRYPDMLCDFIPDLTGKCLSEMSVSYFGESHLGEELTVYMANPRADEYLFRTVRSSDQKTGIEARLVFKKESDF